MSIGGGEGGGGERGREGVRQLYVSYHDVVRCDVVSGMGDCHTSMLILYKHRQLHINIHAWHCAIAVSTCLCNA